MVTAGTVPALNQLAAYSNAHKSSLLTACIAPQQQINMACVVPHNKHTCLMLVSACRRWVGQHGDQARELQAVQDARQQAEDRVEALSAQLEQEQQQVAQQKDRCGSWS